MAMASTPRSDGLYFEKTDYTDVDQMHHSAIGIQKMGQRLLTFFKTDPTTRGWFLKH